MTTDAEWLDRARRSARACRAAEAQALELLPPHASLRRYARASIAGRPEIAMLMPAPAAAPDEVGGSVAASVAGDPFVVVQRWLSSAGVPVPALYAIDEEAQALWLEDLGATDFDQALTAEPATLEARYVEALALLETFQQRTTAPPPLVAARHFGADLLAWEVDHYLEWRVEAWLGHTLSVTARAALLAPLGRLVQELAAMPVVPMHRDFQSHNIMVTGRGLVLLDFQDAMLGPLVYDAVALLRDSYVRIPAPILQRLIRTYAERSAARHGVGAAQIERWFHLMTVQRKLKDAARFVFIDRVKGNPGFLRYIDASVAYVAEALEALGTDWSDLRAAIATVDPRAAG